MDRQIESLNFNLQESTAIITYASTLTFKNSGKEMRSINSETWTHADGKWLCLHSHTSQFAAEQIFFDSGFSLGAISLRTSNR